MIVCDTFDDDSHTVGWLQHDVYYDALGVIRRECREMTARAAAILGVETPVAATILEGIDHRALQHAHDIIASAWRYRSNIVQRALPFDDSVALADQDDGVADSWLAWLREEVQSWDRSPYLVRGVLAIVEHCNTDRGYVAEDELTAALLARYSDVPWFEHMRAVAPLRNNTRVAETKV